MTPTKQHNVISFRTDHNNEQFFIEYADGTMVEYEYSERAKAYANWYYRTLYNEENIEKFKASMKEFEINN